jgi:hypothetical protein
MARFGVEAIRYFSHARAAHVDTAGDLTYTFNRSNGLDNKLRGAGHTRAFYWANPPSRACGTSSRACTSIAAPGT